MRNGSTSNVTIDATKHYLVFACAKMNNDTNNRCAVWYINQGQLSATDVQASSYGEVTINSSGTQITLKGVNTASAIYYTNFVIMQLD